LLQVKERLEALEDEGDVDVWDFKRSVTEYYSASIACLGQW